MESEKHELLVDLGVRLRWPFLSACRGKGYHGVRQTRDVHGLGVRLQWAFPPACRGKGRLMDFVRVCDGLSPLPVEEKAVSWTWLAFAMAFSPCLSRKRPSHGLGVRLRWAFPPACRGKVFSGPP